MRIIDTEDDLAEGVAHLVAVEPRFQKAIDLAGMPPLRRRDAGFASLLQIIVGQQVSVAAAAKIWQRIGGAGATTPERVLAMDAEALRGLGLSRPKARYAAIIAQAVTDGTLDLDACATGEVGEAIKSLTAVTGIGPWTAEIYLMFCVGRADIFADKDLALQESARMLFGMETRPTHREIAILAQPWSPWRAVAARVLWAYYREAKGREGIAE